MFKIQIICVGKLHYKELYETSKRLEKMISQFSELTIVETKESNKPFPKNLEEEGKKIIQTIKGDYIILTDANGVEMDSYEFAKVIEEKMNTGKSISIIIGGHQGVSEEIKKLAHLRISFSKMTFGHNIFRIMLLEQIYRAFSIITNTGYNK